MNQKVVAILAKAGYAMVVGAATQIGATIVRNCDEKIKQSKNKKQSQMVEES